MGSIFDSEACSAALFYPRSDDRPGPSSAKDVFLDVEAGVRLHARIHPNPHATAVLIHFHGNGEVVADYDGFASNFAAAGVTLVSVDYRGYGKSTGAPNYRTCLADAQRVVVEFDSRLAISAERRLPLVVMGRSLGAVCAAEVAGAHLPQVDGIVVDSGRATLEAMAERGVPGGGALLDEADYAAFCPLRKHARSSLPLLVLHGGADNMIPPSEAERTFAASGAVDRELVVIPGWGHNQVMWAPEYWQAIARFVRRVVKADLSGVGNLQPP
jgi:alpha-beta hydrolase superfamily lysophospholipase